MGQLFNCYKVILELQVREKETECFILGGTFSRSLDYHKLVSSYNPV